jgi:hypothetical protein
MTQFKYFLFPKERIYGSVFGRFRGEGLLLKATARYLNDGSIIVCVPEIDSSNSSGRTKDTPKPPIFAKEISKQDAERLVGETLA